MGQTLQFITDIVLTTRQRYNLKAPSLTNRDREAVDSATRFERINGQITIDRRITKEENHHDNRNATTA